MTVVNRTREFEEWIRGLEPADQVSIMRAVAMLEARGIALGEPHSSAIRGSRFPIRELRPRRGASPLRVIYAFDPLREALLLLGGSKASEHRFYPRAIARAEALGSRHLEELEAGEGP